MKGLMEVVRKSNMNEDAKHSLGMYLGLLEVAFRDTDRMERNVESYELLEYRGWKLSYPRIIHSYNKFHLWKDGKRYSIISGSGFTSSTYICLEAMGNGQPERFMTLDEVIDWIENGEKIPDDDEETTKTD